MNIIIEEMNKKMMGVGMGSKCRKTSNQKTEKYARKLYQK